MDRLLKSLALKTANAVNAVGILGVVWNSVNKASAVPEDD